VCSECVIIKSERAVASSSVFFLAHTVPKSEYSLGVALCFDVAGRQA